MSSPNKIISFKLDQETISQLMNAKNIKLDVKKTEAPELVLPEARVKLDIDKQSNATATYYNNKSTNLHFLGSTVSANVTTIRQDTEKQRNKTKNDRKKTTRGVESLDIPSVPPPPIKTITTSPVLSPPLTSTTKSSSQKKSSNLSNNNNNASNIKNSSKKSKSTTASTTNTNNSNIPRTPQSNTPRPSSTPVPNEKLSDRVVQLLALRPYQISTMAKILDCTQWDVKKIVDDVALLLPDPSQKKKYCLKPSMYKKARIWDWPTYTHEEKLTVYDNVSEAYDLLQIPIDSPERNNLINPASPTATNHKLIQPPPGRVQITTERDRAIAAKKSSNQKNAITPISNGTTTVSSLSDLKLLKPEKRNSPDLKGNKGKTTPSGFTYTATTPEPPAPSPSTTTSTSRSSPSSNKIKQTQRLPTSQQLKPSSSNKKVGSKALPQGEKSSPPTKRKMDLAPSPLITTSTPVPPATSPATSSKRLKPSSSASASSNDEPHDIELLKIVSQSMFDKYCAKFISSQKEYQHTRMKFMAKFPQYIRALETTEPPKTGIKRSYYDTKVEYYDMVKENYLKSGDESSWKEAEAYLNEWNQKRRRLNYMWNSIEKNMKEHRYQLNHL